MNPRIRPGQIPPFHEIGEYPFQDLCRDLYDVQPGIATCEIYGTRRQAQDGIDLLAHRAASDAIEVGQCKCYKAIKRTHIRDVSDEFFKHWERWSRENINKFVLFVACDLSDRHLQDEILQQKRRFEERGIVYEAWSAAEIRNKLRPHPAIVSTYCQPADHWVKEICGESSPVLAQRVEETQKLQIVLST